MRAGGRIRREGMADRCSGKELPCTQYSPRQPGVKPRSSSSKLPIDALSLDKETTFICLDTTLDDQQEVNLAAGCPVKVI
jgi:hypothetical protein